MNRIQVDGKDPDQPCYQAYTSCMGPGGLWLTDPDNQGIPGGLVIAVKFDMSGKTDGLWHEYIVMVKGPGVPWPDGSVADGVPKLRVDGVLQGTHAGCWLARYRDYRFGAATIAWGVWLYPQLNSCYPGVYTPYFDESARTVPTTRWAGRLRATGTAIPTAWGKPSSGARSSGRPATAAST